MPELPTQNRNGVGDIGHQARHQPRFDEQLVGVKAIGEFGGFEQQWQHKRQLIVDS